MFAMTIRIGAILFAFIVALTSPMAWSQEGSTAPSNAGQIREAIKTDLPAPPDGFEWHQYRNVVFPKPAKWKGLELVTNIIGIPFYTYASSSEDFSATKQFEMGVTVQIISGSQRIRKIEARTMAMAYLKPLLDGHKKEEVLMLEQSVSGDFQRIFFRYRDAPPGLTPIIVHKFMLANNATDSVHIFTFESPAASWDDNWTRYGTPILSKVNLVPNMAAE
jgi:hypothetical protein